MMNTPEATTRVCAIFGHPVGHSLSPALHNAAFQSLGLDLVYVAHDVAPARLADAFAGARALGYVGLSITIPHKVAALALVDELDPVARNIGCINTVVARNGQLYGTNSDGRGALSALRRAGVAPTGQNLVLLGSGGAARAIAVTIALEASPRRITLLGVVPEELEQLGADLRRLGTTEIETASLDERRLAVAMEDAQLLLNTTPIGMSPNTEQSLVPPDYLHPGLAVFDAVYTPERTRLLRDAEERGAKPIFGLEMFLGQAEVQFRLFTGREPPLALMRDVVVSRLRG